MPQKEFSMHHLINLPLPISKPAAAAENAPLTPATGPGVFLTHQSVITFPIASAIVTIIWQVLARVYPAWQQNDLVPLVIALLVGSLLYWQGNPPTVNAKERVLTIFYALLNAFTLAAAALGIGAIAG
jgi:hypothetical protein